MSMTEDRLSTKSLMAHVVGSMYPVGCYIENSDPNFDPNYDIGGQWESVAITNDHIIEEGTIDIWQYRKWESGIVEAWGKYDATISNYTTVASNTLGGYTVTIDLPFAITNPVANYSAKIGTAIAVTGTAIAYADSGQKTQLSLYALASTTGNVATTWVVDVKGAWTSVTPPPTIYRWHRMA